MSEPKWTVKAVTANDDYTMDIVFADGAKKRFDARYLLEHDLFKPLRNIDFFKNVRVVFDTIAWDENIDIAPEHLYERSVPID